MIAVSIAPVALAAAVEFDLFGSVAQGWGFTAGSMTKPGPQVTVDVGDSVTIHLNSADALPHRFLLDYDGDGTADANEPASGFFTAQETITFTADVAGTFTYFCTVHPSMSGPWTTNAAPGPGDLSAALTRRSAWPARHHMDLSDGSTQTFYALVRNTGSGVTTANVVFTIMDRDTGLLVATVASNVANLPVGATAEVSATWTASVGRFSVTAQVMFDSNGDGTLDGSSPDTKTFGFAAVP